MNSRLLYIVKWKPIFLSNLYCYFFLRLNKWCLPLTLRSTIYPRRFYWEYFSFILVNLRPCPWPQEALKLIEKTYMKTSDYNICIHQLLQFNIWWILNYKWRSIASVYYKIFMAHWDMTSTSGRNLRQMTWQIYHRRLTVITVCVLCCHCPKKFTSLYLSFNTDTTQRGWYWDTRKLSSMPMVLELSCDRARVAMVAFWHSSLRSSSPCLTAREKPFPMGAS